MTPEAFQAISAAHTDYDALLAKQDLGGALREVDRFIALEPMAGYPHGYRGRVLCAMERWREAADEFQRNSGFVRPDIDDHFWQMMCALVLAGDPVEYGRRLESVVEPDWELLPANALSLECIGFGLVSGVGDPRRTAQAISRRFAQELANPSEVLLQADFSLVLARAGRLAEAESRMRQALASPLLPSSERPLMEHRRIYLALILALRRDHNGATAELDRAEASMGLMRSDGQLMSGVGNFGEVNARAETESRAVFTVLRREVKQLLGSP
jgi:hypothetical protein